MKAWEKAKEKFPYNNINDFIELSCPSSFCKLPDMCIYKWERDTELCTKCWKREVSE